MPHSEPASPMQIRMSGKTDDQWKEAKMKKYNQQDRSWDVNRTGDEDGPIVSCRDYEIKLNEGDEERQI